MDAEKAIKLLEVIDKVIDACPSQFESEENTINDFGNAMIAAVEALEKQRPKKNKKENGCLEWDICPNCGYKRAGSHFKYCHSCGQRIDWE